MNGQRTIKPWVVGIGILLFVLAGVLFVWMIEPDRSRDRILYYVLALLPTAVAIRVAVACVATPCPKKKHVVCRERRGNVFAPKQGPLSVDSMYAQLYTEMRRYRDHEQRVVTWWTTILLAVVAGIIHFSTQGQGIHYGIRVVLVVTVVCLSSAMTCLIAYTNRRYQDLREHTNRYYDHVFQPRPELTVMRIGGFIRTLIPMWIVTMAACALLGFADLIPLGCR